MIFFTLFTTLFLYSLRVSSLPTADNTLVRRLLHDSISEAEPHLSFEKREDTRYGDGPDYRVPDNVLIQDNRNGQTQPMSPEDERRVRDAWAHARLLAQIALEVQEDDPLVEVYFGHRANYFNMRRVFEAILGFNPQAGETVRITRENPTQDTQGTHAITIYDQLQIVLQQSWFDLPSFGVFAFAPGPTGDPDAQPLSEHLWTRGGALFHELIHLVTHMREYTTEPARNGLTGLGYRNILPRVRDLRPADFIITRTDQAIVNGMVDLEEGRAYHYNNVLGLARMEDGRYTSLLNVNNYVFFALAAAYNRRHAVGIDLDPPTAWAHWGAMWDPRVGFFRLEVFQTLCLVLATYNRRGMLGKVPPANPGGLRKRALDDVVPSYIYV